MWGINPGRGSPQILHWATCDLLVAQGGTGVLAETPEIYGAEHLLTERAIDRNGGSRSTVDQLVGRLHRAKPRIDGQQPQPETKKGAAILEKSPGAAAKGGTTPLTGVYKYAEPVRARGSHLWTARYDPASVTGQIAGAVTLCVSTGRGSALDQACANHQIVYQHGDV